MKPRKTPRQARAGETNAVLLEAAARVLAVEGAASFTTNRVAEKAGVSIGSLYQYYPNKEALLFALQEKEIAATTEALEAILGDDSVPPRVRLGSVVHRFLQTEADEGTMRRSLEAVGVRTEATPATAAARERMAGAVAAFLRSSASRTLPNAGFEIAAVITMVSSVAQAVTREPVAEAELRCWADTLGEMIAERFGIAD